MPFGKIPRVTPFPMWRWRWNLVAWHHVLRSRLLACLHDKLMAELHVLSLGHATVAPHTACRHAIRNLPLLNWQRRPLFSRIGRDLTDGSSLSVAPLLHAMKSIVAKEVQHHIALPKWGSKNG